MTSPRVLLATPLIVAALVLSVCNAVIVSVGGVTASFYADAASGGTIVPLAIALFLVAASYSALRARITGSRHAEAEQYEHQHGANRAHPAIEHEHDVDYLHDGHPHAPHEDHYDEHDLLKSHDEPVRR
jgi:zinc transport system permease protein